MPTSSPELARLLLEWQENHRLGRPLTAEQLHALKQHLAAIESAEHLSGNDVSSDGQPSTVSTPAAPAAEQATGDYCAEASASGPPIHPRLGPTTSLAPPGYELLSALGNGGRLRTPQAGTSPAPRTAGRATGSFLRIILPGAPCFPWHVA